MTHRRRTGWTDKAEKMTKTDNNDTEGPAEKAAQTTKGLGLSPIQVIAGGGAAAVASVIGGNLGLAGTVVGAFILSVVSAIALPLFAPPWKRATSRSSALCPDASRMQPGQRAHRWPRTPPASSGPPPARSPLRPCRRSSLGRHRRCTARPPQVTQGPEGLDGYRWNSHHLRHWSGVDSWHPVSHGCGPFAWNQRSPVRYYPGRVNCQGQQGHSAHGPETERPGS